MRGAHAAPALRDVHRLLRGGTVAGLSDEELLGRFLASRDAVAFEALVIRHGPGVLASCRTILGDDPAVEDAFQAVFLVLVRKAPSIRVDGSLGRWLRGVSRRVAVRAAKGRSRRRSHEVAFRPGLEPAGSDPDDADRREVAALLRSEIAGLPASYRDPIVAHYFEGLSHEGVAARMRWPIGTVKGRLARARRLLRDRLARRGVGLSAGALAASLAREASAAIVRPALQDATVEAALRLAAGKAPFLALAGTAPAALALSRGVARTMILSKLSIGLAATFVSGAALAAGFRLADGGGNGPPAAQDGKAPASGSDRPESAHPDLNLAGPAPVRVADRPDDADLEERVREMFLALPEASRLLDAWEKAQDTFARVATRVKNQRDPTYVRAARDERDAKADYQDYWQAMRPALARRAREELVLVPQALLNEPAGPAAKAEGADRQDVAPARAVPLEEWRRVNQDLLNARINLKRAQVAQAFAKEEVDRFERTAAQLERHVKALTVDRPAAPSFKTDTTPAPEAPVPPRGDRHAQRLAVPFPDTIRASDGAGEAAQSERPETIAYHVGDLVNGPPGLKGEHSVDFRPLMELITSTVAPETWKAPGEPEGHIRAGESPEAAKRRVGTMLPVATNSSLLIRQTPTAHRAIVERLRQIRRLREIGPEPAEPKFSPNTTEKAAKAGVGTPFDSRFAPPGPEKPAIAAAPAGASPWGDYILEAPDEVIIQHDRRKPGSTASGRYTIREDGTIEIGLLARVRVAGLGLKEAKARIVESLRPAFSDTELGLIETVRTARRRVDPDDTQQVIVTARPFSRFVHIRGAVKEPGRLALNDKETALSAVMRCGLDGTTRNLTVRLIRVRPEDGRVESVRRVSLRSILEEGDPSTNFDLRPGDILDVQRSPEEPGAVREAPGEGLKFVTRTYDLSDLVPRDSPAMRPARGFSESEMRRAEALITAAIPAAWGIEPGLLDAQGRRAGSLTSSLKDGTIAIEHTEATHAKIAELLSMLRRLRAGDAVTPF